jgi:GABA(A) receptor-associated protein
MSFKSKVPFKERFENSQNIMSKYPDRIPVICERLQNTTKDIPDIDKNKYLIPNDLTIGQFMYVIRKRLRLFPEKGLFFFINGFIPSSSALLYDIYHTHHDPDGFLYIQYSGENTFG